jgi:hypothetical protein
MKTAVIGSRGIGFFNFDSILEEVEKITQVVTGGAVGVDTLARCYFEKKGVAVEVITPNYKLHGRAATHIRNREIVDTSEAVLAIWDGKSKGTESVIRYARSKGKLVKVILWQINS